MKSRESSLWRWLSQARQTMDQLHLCRVENAVEIGYPDVDGCYKGMEFHIELKVASGKNMVRIDIQPEQVAWLKNRSRAGGRAWVLVQLNDARALIHAPLAGKLLESLTLEEFMVLGTMLGFRLDMTPRQVIHAASGVHF